MGRVKAQRHDRFHSLPNCIADPATLKNHWAERLGSDTPIHLEPGCGKAELSLGLAQLHPNSHFLAIDLKSDRLCRGADLAILQGIQNISFLRMNAEILEAVFPPQSISAIWLTFPDPFPRDRDEKHRLTNPAFLSRFQKILKPGGVVQLKTDNDALTAYTLETLENFQIPLQLYAQNLHQEHPKAEIAQFLTSFEKKFLQRNKNIHYLRFEIPASVSFSKDRAEEIHSSITPKKNHEY